MINTSHAFQRGRDISVFAAFGKRTSSLSDQCSAYFASLADAEEVDVVAEVAWE